MEIRTDPLGRIYLCWTTSEGLDGEPVDVRVFVDKERMLDVARKAAKNKGRRSVSGPIIAEALKGRIYHD